MLHQMSVDSINHNYWIQDALLLPNDLRGFSAFTSSKMSKMSGVSPSKDCRRSNRHWADTPLLVPLFAASCSNKRHSCHPRNVYLEVWTTFAFDKRSTWSSRTHCFQPLSLAWLNRLMLLHTDLCCPVQDKDRWADSTPLQIKIPSTCLKC